MFALRVKKVAYGRNFKAIVKDLVQNLVAIPKQLYKMGFQFCFFVCLFVFSVKCYNANGKDKDYGDNDAGD